ncbi:MAG: 23S rRNA (pseudouridine(1915)-N(3))-methyltransferase RlmH [Gammaproteobacteria bacterium]|nr:23S rRNA (pseudouridine(1915)-N(3))-methyltransferase RlmH [Gammaproteobacteria bacterium]
MKIEIINQCHKMQPWQKAGFDMYAKRIPAEIILNETLHSQKKIKTSKTKHYTIALDRLGKSLSSIEISERLTLITQKSSHIIFNIGASEGLNQTEIDSADECWSLSALTFPHQLSKIILIEQLYRSFCILSNHPYHK